MSQAAMVLVVEDEALILMDLEAALEEAGFRVLAAANATAAKSLYADHGGEIRAVLTDIRLGEGPSGWEFAQQVRENAPNMPIVYVSGDSYGEWASRGVPNSVMIPKPYAFAQLVTALSMLMNAPDQLPAPHPL